MRGRLSIDKARLEVDKRVVARLFDEVIYGTGDRTALIDELIARDYIVHHNPNVGADSEGPRAFLELLGPLSKSFGPTSGREVRYISDRGFVVRQEIRDNGEMIDVIRVSEGQCREHWTAFRPFASRERLSGY